MNTSKATVTPYGRVGELIEKSAKITLGGLLGKRSICGWRCRPEIFRCFIELLTKGLDLAFDHGCEIRLVFALETCEKHEGRYTVPEPYICKTLLLQK
jgi:hypothetical protein